MKFWHDNTLPRDNPQGIFNEKRGRNALVLGAFGVLYLLSSRLIEFDFWLIFIRLFSALDRFVGLYFPPNFTNYQDLFEGIWVTIALSVAAGTIGSALAYATAIGMSKRTGRIPLVKVLLRVVATFLRNVPAAIWAIVLLMAFWFGEFLALLVMSIGTFGFNARLFSDMIDETNHGSIEALEATGATYWQIIFQSVFPETLPVAISWTLYAIETNIRSATIIGILAGGGIGHLIGIYKHFRRFDELTAAVILVVITITAFDQLSIQIRKRLL